jgi:hypothetical protein
MKRIGTSETRDEPLQDEIASAFSQSTPSDEIASLIERVNDAVKAADEDALNAREVALNPALSGIEIALCRRQMEDAAFKRDRLAEAASRLGGRLKEMLREEEDMERWRRYNQAKLDRDALAAEIKEVYPALTEKLADLTRRLAANDRVVELINGVKLPSGAPRLKTAEALARDLAGVPGADPTAPRIAKMLRLPAFVQKPNRPYEWPPSL